MKYLSLFSGIGGFELGIQQTYVETTSRKTDGRGEEYETNDDEEWQRLESKKGKTARATKRQSRKHIDGSEEFRQPTCVGYSEIDKYAIQIYEKHFNHKNFGDITKISTDTLPNFDLLVGGFPCQSFSIAGKRKGFEDTRGTLFFEIARICKAKRPRLLLLENVKGLLSHDNGNTFKTIISTLDELGYDLQWQVLNSKNFGVPQNRERVFIIGHLRGTPRPEVFPIGETNKGIDEGKFSISGKIQTDTETKHKSDIDSTILENGENRSIRIRKLTPLECERLQGFPDNWTQGVSDTQRYKTLGNAVTVNVIENIISRIL